MNKLSEIKLPVRKILLKSELLKFKYQPHTIIHHFVVVIGFFGTAGVRQDPKLAVGLEGEGGDKGREVFNRRAYCQRLLLREGLGSVTLRTHVVRVWWVVDLLEPLKDSEQVLS